MSTLVTQEAPDFTATAVLPDNTFDAEFKLSALRGKYVLLFFYPLDFTFVCPSEIIAFGKKVKDFKAKNCEVVGVSVDSHSTHLPWKNTPPDPARIANLQSPLAAPFTKKIHKEGVVRHALVNDLPLGRSVDEALRMLDALQYTEEHGEVCPANWKEGEEAMTPSAEGVASYLANNA